jgi:hypothetical protein
MSQSNDIVRELEAWLAELGANVHNRAALGTSPEIEIDLVRRAVAEINGLREKLGQRRGTDSIPTEDLNASNDE